MRSSGNRANVYESAFNHTDCGMLLAPWTVPFACSRNTGRSENRNKYCDVGLYSLIFCADKFGEPSQVGCGGRMDAGQNGRIRRFGL